MFNNAVFLHAMVLNKFSQNNECCFYKHCKRPFNIVKTNCAFVAEKFLVVNCLMKHFSLMNHKQKSLMTKKLQQKVSPMAFCNRFLTRTSA